MKKKLSAFIVIAVISVLSVLLFSACGAFGSKPSGHTHNYQWTDNGDGTHNGHCSVLGCYKPDILNENHVFGTDDKCVKCKAVKPND